MTLLPKDLHELRRPEKDEFLAAARRYAMPGFDVETFWEHMIEHLDAPIPERILVLHDLVEGNIPPRRLLELQREIEEKRSFWNRYLGVELADLLRRKIARCIFDPWDTAAVLALRSGDPDEDAALLLYVFMREAGGPTPAAGERRLRAAVALGPRHPSIWTGLANGLLMLAREKRSAKVQKRLFREVERWLDEALRQAPEHPQALFARGEVLTELAVLSEGAKRRDLLRRSKQSFEAAGRGEGIAASSLRGAACVALLLPPTAEDEAQRRQEQEEAHRLLQQAVEGGEPNLRLLLAHSALDRGWRTEDATEARRASFEEARAHGEACSAIEGLRGMAFASWGCAVVGLAAVSPPQERRSLTAQAVDLFRCAEAWADEPEESPPKASSAWLSLAAESTGEGRREACRLAADAARLLSRKHPGEGDYDLARALSHLGEHAEAAGWLISALKRDPSLASSALEDPDLRSLWEARPQLRQRVEASGIP